MPSASSSRIPPLRTSPRSNALFATTAISPFFRISSALLSLAILAHPPPPRDPPTATVLFYHNFDAQKVTAYNLELKRFQEQMRHIKVQHLPVIPLAQLVDHLTTGAPIPDHAVVITIDDGYKTARTKAWPLLKEYGFPFTVFIYPQYIGHKNGLSWEDVRTMSRAGVDFQSHSMTHPLLTHPPKSMSRAEYVAWIDHELVDSKRIIEEQTGKPVTAIAYPFGGYDEKVVERTKKAGYVAALTCDDGNVTRLTDAWHINRRLVYRWVKLREYSEYFPVRTLQMANQTPRDGERVKRPITEIRARVLNVQQILPGSGSVLGDKLGRHGWGVGIDQKTGRVGVPVPAVHKSGYYFISLFARDKADPTLRREASWIFIISKNVPKN